MSCSQKNLSIKGLIKYFREILIVLAVSSEVCDIKRKITSIKMPSYLKLQLGTVLEFFLSLIFVSSFDSCKKISKIKMSEISLTNSLRSNFYRKNNFKFSTILVEKLWPFKSGNILKFD